MKKEIFVKEINQKDKVSDFFLLKYISEHQSKDGKAYLSLILEDTSGQIDGRMWGGYKKHLSDMKPGDVVFVEGKGNRYQKKIQLIIDQIKLMNSFPDMDVFIKKSDESSQRMMKDLMDIVESLDDYYIRELLKKILLDSKINERLHEWPAAKSVHHAYRGGLLEHILSCTRLSVHLSKHYKLNVNYVVAGAIIHDICKIFELSSGPVVDYTLEGKLVGHLVKGVELVERFSRKIENFPMDMKLHLKHIVIGHHGQLEFGSPKVPSTLEANLVHYIDFLDSKMSGLIDFVKTDSTSGHWTAFNRFENKSIFKKDLPHYPNPVESFSDSKSPTKLGNMADKLKDIKI